MFIKRFLILMMLSGSACFSVMAQTTKSATAATSNAQTFVGKWVGTFEGASAGNCEMAITQSADGKYVGTITVIPTAESRYEIAFKTLTLEGNKLKATYSEPGEDSSISLEGMLTDATVKGTWQANDGNATGTWTVTRQTK